MDDELVDARIPRSRGEFSGGASVKFSNGIGAWGGLSLQRASGYHQTSAQPVRSRADNGARGVAVEQEFSAAAWKARQGRSRLTCFRQSMGVRTVMCAGWRRSGHTAAGIGTPEKKEGQTSLVVNATGTARHPRGGHHTQGVPA
ncbi:hypothetical protein G6F35_014413 [Rhizopus arrhizus]|nr:hypothetical protein G6F35_014413 [Rhizopus arrhizus]